MFELWICVGRPVYFTVCGRGRIFSGRIPSPRDNVGVALWQLGVASPKKILQGERFELSYPLPGSDLESLAFDLTWLSLLESAVVFFSEADFCFGPLLYLFFYFLFCGL